MKKKKKGFTLIEMIVVIAIIGILSTMLLTSVARIRKNSIDTRRKSNLENVRGAVNMYYSATSYWPCYYKDSDNQDPNDLCTNTAFNTDFDLLMNVLSAKGYISDTIKADEDSDGTKDYSIEACTSPCQMKILASCMITDAEGCDATSKKFSVEVK